MSYLIFWSSLFKSFSSITPPPPQKKLAVCLFMYFYFLYYDRSAARKRGLDSVVAPTASKKRKFDKLDFGARKKKRKSSSDEESATKEKKRKIEKIKKKLSNLKFRSRERLKNILKKRKTERLGLIKFYKSQLGSKPEYLERGAKRKFDPEIHEIDKDVNIAEKTRKLHDGRSKLPGRLLTKKLTCASCNKVFVTSEAFLNHKKFDKKFKKPISISAFKARENEFELLCPLANCCFHTNNIDVYLKHLTTHSIHEKNTVYIYQSPDPPKNILECDRCHITFTRKSSLNKHREQCLGTQPITCAVCDETFKDTLSLLDHLDDVHRPSNQYRLLHEFTEAKKTTDDEDGQYSTKQAQEFASMRQKMRKKRSTFLIYTILFNKVNDVPEILNDELLEATIEQLNFEASKNFKIKFSFYLHTVISKYDENGEKKFQNCGLISSTDFLIDFNTDIEKIAVTSFDDLLSRAEQVSKNRNVYHFTQWQNIYILFCYFSSTSADRAGGSIISNALICALHRWLG